MTVSSTTIKTSPYACDGVTVQFSFPFAIWESSEVKVILRTVATGAEVVLTETTHYDVTLSTATPSAGYITTVATYSADYQIVIAANFPFTQEVDYGEGDKFPASSHEEALDRGVRLTQQLLEKFSRAILFPATTTLSDIELPEISASNANFFLGVNNVGTALAWGEPVDLGNLTTHDTGHRETIHQNMLADLAADTNTVSAGLGIVSTAAEVADGSEATKIVSPSGLASVLQYENIQIPGGSIRPAVSNAGTQSIQEYPSSAVPNEGTTTRDYIELGNSGDASVKYDFTLWMPETWDRATLKIKAALISQFDTGISAGSALAIGFQIKAYNSGSPITSNWSTPPVYIYHTKISAATNIEEETVASANIASSVDGSTNRLDIRVSRKNTISNNASAPVWLTQLLLQFKKTNQVSGW